MGFKVGRTFVLDFTGTELDGAEVTFRSCSIGDLQDLYAADGVAGPDGEAVKVARFLVKWNLEDQDGAPIPATAAGLLSLEAPAYRLVVGEWMKATKGITAPLDHRSNAGAGLPDSIEIPMEIQ